MRNVKTLKNELKVSVVVIIGLLIGIGWLCYELKEERGLESRLKGELQREVNYQKKTSKDLKNIARNGSQIIRNIRKLALSQKKLGRILVSDDYVDEVVLAHDKLKKFVAKNKMDLSGIWRIDGDPEPIRGCNDGLYINIQPLSSGKSYMFYIWEYYDCEYISKNFKKGDYVSIDTSHPSFPGKTREGTSSEILSKISENKKRTIDLWGRLQRNLNIAITKAIPGLDLQSVEKEYTSNSAALVKISTSLEVLWDSIGKIRPVSEAKVFPLEGSLLSQKPFSVEGVEIHDILNSVDRKWEGAEVYVYSEHLTSGERRVFILTCREKGIVSKFRDNLSRNTLVALSNFDKAIKGRVVTWAGRDYQEYYLDSVSDIAVVRERGSELDEMWSVDVETGLEK